MSVGLLEAIDSPRLLNFKAYERQRELLAALEGPAQRAVWCCGRRSGKSRMIAMACLHNALLREDLDRVMDGEMRYVVIIATRHEQARIPLRFLVSAAERSPILKRHIRRVTEDAVEFETAAGARTCVASFPCGSRGARGWPISLLCLDELAHFLDSDGNSSAKQVWDALTPSTAQFGALGRVIASSTPADSSGLFAELFQRASSGEDESAVAFQYPTWMMNPQIDRAWLAAQEADDPEMFKAEFGAEFVGGSGALLEWDRVTVADYVELPPHAGKDWILAVDPSAQRDPFAAVVVGRDVSDPHRLLVGACEAWRPGPVESVFNRDRVEEELFGRAIALGRRFGVRMVISDQFMSKIVTDRFSSAGFYCRIDPWTATSKYESMVDLRSALYTQTLEVPNIPELHHELKQIRMKFAGASSSIVTPRTARGHCDRALALGAGVRALARRGVATGTGDVKIGYSNIMSGDGADTVAWFESRRGRGRRDPDRPPRRGVTPPPGWPGHGGDNIRNMRF